MAYDRSNRPSRTRNGLMCGAAVALATGLGLPGIAFAQSSTSAPATGASETGDIVVTANRRTETVQKANQSITAISGAQLQASGVSSLEQLAGQVPGISQKNEGPGQTEYEMRGMSSSGGSAPTVGFYVDDVALTAPTSSDVNKPVVSPNLYDLNRVEVLRGPQGTLYGSSSMGGTIRLITNQPDPHSFAGSIQATGSGTDHGGFNYGLNAMLNLPLVTDQLALRVVGTESRNSGWIDRVTLGDFPLPTNNGVTRGNVLAGTPTNIDRNANWERTSGIRATLLWQPADNLTIAPSAMYQRLTQGGQNVVDVPPGVRYETHYQPFNIPEPSSDEFELVSLPIKYKVGGVQLDAITGYYHRLSSLRQENAEDLQDFLQVDLNLPLTFGQVGQLNVHNASRDSQFTQELRLSSTGDGPFQWLVGGYYQNFVSRFAISTSQASPYLASFFGAQTELFHLEYRQHVRQYAGFGEASYKLGDLKLTAGLRYYSYDTSLNTYQFGILVTGTGPAGASNTSGTGKSSGVIPRFNISFAPSPDLTLYAQAAKGFRPGSALPPAPITCGALPTQYNPDNVWSYEAGEKARLFDRRLTVNASGYYEDWKNIQQQVANTSCGYNYTGNAGSAHIYGAEAEFVAQITPELVLSTSLAYTDAKLASVPPGSSFVVGQRIQSVPKWTDTTSIVYTHRLSDVYDLVLRASDEYVGNQQVIVNSLYTVPSHNFINMRAGLVKKHGISGWFFVNNLTNKDTIVNQGEPISVFIPSVVRAIVPQPRTIGVEVNFSF